MKKTTIIRSVALGLISVGIGGYFYIVNQVISGVDTAFTTAQHNGLFESVSYGEVEVDLFADTVTINTLKINFDARKSIANSVSMLSLNNISETSSSTYEKIVITGIWNLIKGGHVIAALDGTNSTLEVDVIQSTMTPNGVTTVTNKVNGTMAHESVRGLDVSALLEAHPTLQDLAFISMTSYTIDDMTLDMTVYGKSANSSHVMAPLEIHYKVPQVFAENISPEFIGAVGARNLEMTISPMAPSTRPFKVEIGEVRVSDVKMVDLFPVKMTYGINNLTFDTTNIADPTLTSVMSMMGINELNMNMTIGYEADLKARTFSIAPFTFSIKKIGRFDLALDLSGIPTNEDLQALNQPKTSPSTNTDRPDMTFAEFTDKIAIKNFTIGYQDKGMLKKFIAAQALILTDGNIPALAQGYAQQAALLVNATHGPEKSQAVMVTLAAFFANPNKLTIALHADLPVLVSDLKTALKVSGPSALNAFKLEVTGLQP